MELEIISREMKESNRNGILAHWNERTSELEDYYRTYLEQLDQIADAEELRMADVLNYAQTEVHLKCMMCVCLCMCTYT